jgi:beta-glucosidase/6-phospho-beta-glucosidase/beta-galactosidase
LWLDNQFLNRNYPEAVADYAHALAERYGDRLNAWTPLNEPQWTARLCGESAAWPPELSGHDGYLQVMLAICRGIVMCQQAIKAAVSAAEIVHVEASFRYDVKTGADETDAQLLAQRRFLATDLVTGRVDGAHPLVGYLASHGVRDVELDWFQRNRVTPDVLGMNYYPMWSTLEYANVGDATVAVERDDGVAGLTEVLTVAATRYGVPVMLTETSFEGAIEARLSWLNQSVAAVRDMRHDVDVVGFTWWPFLDQVRWQYREALDPVTDQLHELGLVALHSDEIGRLRRRPTALFDTFRELTNTAASTNRLPKEVSR